MNPLRRRQLSQARAAAIDAAGRSLPISFALVGVQKAATTSFYSMLVEHPEVAGGPQKEITFFIDEDLDWSAPDYSTYRRPARKSQVRVAGDATPAYFFWPGALARMRAYDPGLQLMAIFRDPVERGLSQWAMEKGRRPDFPDLPDALRRYGSMPLPDAVPAVRRTGTFRRSTLFARGLYGAQLARGLDLFPREQWLLLEFRAVFADHVAALDAATDFLGLVRFARHPALVHDNASPAALGGPVPGVDALEALIAHYADDLALFESLSGVDTSGWPTRQVLDGTLPVADLHERLCIKLGLRA